MTTETTETTEKKTVTVTLSDRAPVRIDPEEWPVVACAGLHDGKVWSQANTEWRITVREHKDGRRLVYGWEKSGPGGKPIGYRDTYGGYLVAAGDGLRQPPTDPDGPMRAKPDEEGTVRAIRRVAGLIGDAKLGDECISNLPAQEL